jgi:hypothetical protein
MAARIINAGPYKGARAMKPTMKHRPAMWECMLGTVYASNGTEVKYFDYRWEEAREFAGVDAEGADPRAARAQFATQNGPRRGQFALYIKR